MANEEEPKQMITVTDFSKIYEDMSPFCLQQTFSDVQFIVSDKKFYAHKIVLAARCKYFESLLMQDLNQSYIILTEVPAKAFETILNYIYTGSIAIILSHGDHIFDILKLAHDYSLKGLEKIINEKMTSLVNMSNVCLLLNKANAHGMDELRDICHNFIDEHVSEIVDSDFLNVLTQQAIVKLLERDYFHNTEMDVFKIAANWCRINTDLDNLVSGCVRLTELTQEEILNVVWPSKIIDNDKLLKTLATITNKNSKIQQPFVAHLKNKNIATPKYNAKVISGLNTTMLLQGTENEEEGAYHEENDKNGITLDLGIQRCFNHIKTTILGNCHSSFYIETSVDQQKWHRVIDYSKYSCKSVQNLYFEQQTARYVRLVSLKRFPLGTFAVSFNNKIPEVRNQIVCPVSNVVTSETQIFVWRKRRDDFTVRLYLNQPYIISCMKVLLRFYNSIDNIETSIDYKSWETTSFKISNGNGGWKILIFEERVVSFFSISGQISADKTWRDVKEFLQDFQCCN